MGMVSSVHWTCPGCGMEQSATCSGDYEDPPEGFDANSVPADRQVWDEQCRGCGKYIIAMPPVPRVSAEVITADEARACGYRLA